MKQDSKHLTKNKTDHEDGGYNSGGENLTVRLLDDKNYVDQNNYANGGLNEGDSQLLMFVPSDTEQFDSIELQSPKTNSNTQKSKKQQQHYMAPNLYGNQTDQSYSNGEESDAIFYDARTHTD